MGKEVGSGVCWLLQETHEHVRPYSRKIWWKLNLAVLPKTLVDFNLGDRATDIFHVNCIMIDSEQTLIWW